jgi:hypothetical protein
LEILCFEQQKNESLGKAWERFDSIVNSGPSLTLPEPMLLQHFFLGLDRKTKKLHFLILCLILRMIFLLNLEIPQIIM